MEKSLATEINWITKTVASTGEASMTRVPCSWGPYFFKQRNKTRGVGPEKRSSLVRAVFRVNTRKESHRKRYPSVKLWLLGCTIYPDFDQASLVG